MLYTCRLELKQRGGMMYTWAGGAAGPASPGAGVAPEPGGVSSRLRLRVSRQCPPPHAFVCQGTLARHWSSRQEGCSVISLLSAVAAAA